MLTKNINFKNYKIKKDNLKIKKDFKILIKEKNIIIESLSSSYKNSYTKKLISTLKKYKNFKVIGMGGSILGTESIYDFLKHKIKKNFYFYNNLHPIIGFKNYKQSIKWLLKSSNQGFGPALTMLSACYLEGRGVEKNVVLAHMYSNLAAYHRGDAWSLKSLSTVTDMLTPEQLVTSQKMARKWLEAKE